MTQHDDLNFNSNLGWDIVSGVWDPDAESFADADISSVMFTTANFIQYVGPNQMHPLDANTSVVHDGDMTLDDSNLYWYYRYNQTPEFYFNGDFEIKESIPMSNSKVILVGQIFKTSGTNILNPIYY